MKLLSRIGAWWRRRQRRIDREVLLPQIRRPARARPLATTTAAVVMHLATDWAWSRLDEWENEPVDFVFDQDRDANVAKVLEKRELLAAARRARLSLPWGTP